MRGLVQGPEGPLRVKSLAPLLGPTTAPSEAHDSGVLPELDVIRTNNEFTCTMFYAYYV